MVERHLKCLHAAHRQTRHRAVVAVGDCAERLVDERDQTCVMSSSNAPMRSCITFMNSGEPNGLPVMSGTW